MSFKHVVILVVLVAAAIGVGRWSYTSVKESRPASPLSSRLTLEYQGTVSQLFDTLSLKCGVQYQVNPAVASRTVQGSYQNKSVVQIQADVARQAHLRYRPLDRSGKTVAVDPG